MSVSVANPSSYMFETELDFLLRRSGTLPVVLLNICARMRPSFD